MSAFGYGSSYSFRDGSFMPGPSQGYGGMGQDPRQIVSKSGIDSLKGAMSNGGPGIRFEGQASNPYGETFGKSENVDLSRLTGSSGGSNGHFNYYDNSFFGLRNQGQAGYGNDMGAQLAASALPSNQVYWGGGAPTFDPSRVAAGEMSRYYNQAYNMLNAGLEDIRTTGRNPYNEDPRTGVQLSTTYQAGMDNLQKTYQDWLNQMMGTGAFGLSGGPVSFGRPQGGV